MKWPALSKLEPQLRPETVRGLIVHSASWSKAMLEDFPGLNDRLLACGYGVPHQRLASECAQGVATIVVEDTMPSAVIEEEPKKTQPKKSSTKATEPRVRRKVKLYRVPLPENLLSDSDPRRRVAKWDMQGPQESYPFDQLRRDGTVLGLYLRAAWDARAARYGRSAWRGGATAG